MAVYLFTKDRTLLQEIQTHLLSPVRRVSQDRWLKKLCSDIVRDPHPVLIIDEAYHTQGIFPLLEYILSTRIPGPKILIPARKGIQSSFASDGSIAVLYRPFTAVQLTRCLLSVSSLTGLKGYLKEEYIEETEQNTSDHTSPLIGASPQIRKIRKMIGTIGAQFKAIHITGESGTGKEVVADSIISGSCDPMAVEKVNCSAIPPTLADSFLFGSRKGAFTDSKEDRKGCIERAHRGILFLDEIEDFPLNIQGKLLRVLESGEYLPVGSEKTYLSRFQLITASNVDIAGLSEKRLFRADLYHRITGIVINIPPLRERKEDIPLLCSHYLSTEREERTIEEESLKSFSAYRWPGNIRELFNVLDQLRLFTPPSKPLSVQYLPSGFC